VEEHAVRMAEKRTAYRSSVGKPEGKSPLLKPRCMLVDDIKMELRAIEWGGVD
jgi:hypothetical protein